MRGKLYQYLKSLVKSRNCASADACLTVDHNHGILEMGYMGDTWCADGEMNFRIHRTRSRIVLLNSGWVRNFIWISSTWGNELCSVAGSGGGEGMEARVWQSALGPGGVGSQSGTMVWLHCSQIAPLSVVKTQTVTALKHSQNRVQPNYQYRSLEGWFGSWCQL